MKEKAQSPRGFRPWPENQERIEYAEKIGVPLSEFLNELIQKHGRDLLKGKAQVIQRTLEAPVP